MATDWNKHGAIAGYGAWVFAAASIAVMVWLARQPPPGAVSANVAGGTSVIPTWALWTAPSIYAIGIIGAAVFHYMAKRHVPSEATKQKTSTEDAPKIVIEYKKEGLLQTLEFFNDGPQGAMEFQLQPLVWEEKRYITLAHLLPPLPSKHRHVCQMFFERSPGHGEALVDYMKDIPNNTETTVTLIYSDQNSRMFSRKFTLTRFPDNTLAWQPGEVKRLGKRGEPIA
jgi:hypothetical protein